MNKIKGDVELQLGGEVYYLRPTFDAYRLIEADLGMGSMLISTRLVGRIYGVTDITAIVKHGVDAAGGDSEKALTEMLEGGLILAVPACIKYLAITFQGTRGEEEEELEKNSDQPPNEPTE